MSRIRADKLVNKNASGGPDLPLGATISGVVTATTFSGGFTGSGANLTDVPATSLTGTPNITVGTIGAGNVTSSGTVSGVTGNFSGNVDVTGNISVGGTLTYEDVTNVDSVGVVTARQGIKVLAGGINAVGVITASSYEGRHSQVPKNAQTSSYTLVKTDAGKCVSTNSGVTVPDAVFAAGDCVTIWNDSSSAITITQGSGFQLREAGETSTGNVSLKNFGLATLWFNTGGTAVISGNLA